MGETKKLFRILVGKSRTKRPLRRPRRRWKYNIQMDDEEIDFEYMHFTFINVISEHVNFHMYYLIV
jgi:hypothetical protein